MNVFVLKKNQIRSRGKSALEVAFSLLRRLLGSHLVNILLYNIASLAAIIKRNWVKAYEMQGDALLNLNRFEEGIARWHKAVSLRKEDRFAEVYKRSVILLHRGQWDAEVDLLKMGMEIQEEYARNHQLDELGIRFLREWTYAIGHIALLDFYVKMGILGLRNGYLPVVLDAKPANPCYLNYWRRYLPAIITDPAAIELLNPLASRLEDHLHVISFKDGSKIYHLTAGLEIQERWESEGRGPLLSLSDLDHERGRECLKKMGVPQDVWFVSLHVRDTNSANGRDSDINTYRLAIESITQRGGWVIRMGNPSMPRLLPMSQVIDYAHSEFRSDWMDVFLWAACRFFLGTRSGPAYVPPTFGVPCVLTNSFPMVTPFPHKHLGIYKLYWSEKENRYLTFREAFASDIQQTEDPRYINSLGIKPVPNTPEEIKDVVLETLESLEGKLKYSDEDDKLLACFKNLKPDFKNRLGTSPGRVGRNFLQKYNHLL